MAGANAAEGDVSLLTITTGVLVSAGIRREDGSAARTSSAMAYGGLYVIGAAVNPQSNVPKPGVEPNGVPSAQ